MHRFFVPATVINDSLAELRGAHAHQIARVLRLRPGEHVELFDGSGRAWRLTLTVVTPDVVSGTLIPVAAPTPEPRLQLTLVQGLLKGDATGTVIQKAVEIGIAAIVPAICDRSIPRGVDVPRLARWQRIAQEAAEQSGRLRVPPVVEPAPLPAALATLADAPVIVLWEGERTTGLAAALRSWPAMPAHLALVVGPEGGLTAKEVDQAMHAGARVACLGPRVLRAETAGLVAAAAMLYDAGDLGGR